MDGPTSLLSRLSLSSPVLFILPRAVTLQSLMGVRMLTLPGPILYRGGPAVYLVREREREKGERRGGW